MYLGIHFQMSYCWFFFFLCLFSVKVLKVLGDYGEPIQWIREFSHYVKRRACQGQNVMCRKANEGKARFCQIAVLQLRQKKKSTFIFPNGMTFDTPSPHPSPNSSLSRRKNHLEHWRDTIEIFHIYCKYGKVSHHSIGHGTTWSVSFMSVSLGHFLGGIIGSMIEMELHPKKKTTPDPVYDNNLWSTKPWKGHKKLVFATPNKASHHFLIAIDITINWRHCQYFFFPPKQFVMEQVSLKLEQLGLFVFFTLQHLYKTFCQCGMLNWVGRQVTNAEMTAD